MRIVTTTRELEPHLGAVLVPTMGALHEGHAALIRRAVALAAERGWAAGCVVSVFVNPTQFNQSSDYNRYPRTLEADAEVCRACGAAAVFAPSEATVYPPPPAPPIEVPPLPDVATRPGLEDRFRPGHFAGVCQVVNRLFKMTQPAAAIFGEKDWQQLRVVSGMTEQSSSAVEIVPHPTLRDPDGLALSSRNRFLSADDRRAALAIPRALAAASAIRGAKSAEAALRECLDQAGLKTEYAVIRDAQSLGPISDPTQSGRALIAAWCGGVRLIDNAPWSATS